VLRVKQVAERLNLSESKVYEMVESGELPHHRFGGAIRVSEDQIAEFLEDTKRERREPESRNRGPRRPLLKHIRLS
jgi:excisionase family DNA binding protein